MIIQCKSNSLEDLPKAIRKLALPLNESGTLDISVGKYYQVYGRQTTEDHLWYLVHTDTEYIDGYWWMPAVLYDVYDASEPRGWKELDADTQLQSYSLLADWKVAEGIEDGEEESILLFTKQVSKDGTFPTDEKLDTLNQEFYQTHKEMLRTENKRLADDNGWDEQLLNSNEKD